MKLMTLLALWLWGAAGIVSASSAPVAASNIKVYEARVMVPLAGVQEAQVFLRLQNLADHPVDLVSAVSPYAEAVLIKSKSTSQVIKQLKIPPKTLVNLTPESEYLVLSGLKVKYQTGDQLHLKLIFSDNSRVEVTAVAKSAFDQPHH